MNIIKRILTSFWTALVGCIDRGEILPEGKTVCMDCGSDDGTLLKEFQEEPEKSYYWSELAEMTPVCASCGSENLGEILPQEDNQ